MVIIYMVMNGKCNDKSSVRPIYFQIIVYLSIKCHTSVNSVLLSQFNKTLIYKAIIFCISYGNTMVITDANLTKLILDWCNKGRGMYCLVCGIVHIKDPSRSSVVERPLVVR